MKATSDLHMFVLTVYHMTAYAPKEKCHLTLCRAFYHLSAHCFDSLSLLPAHSVLCLSTGGSSLQGQSSIGWENMLSCFMKASSHETNLILIRSLNKVSAGWLDCVPGRDLCAEPLLQQGLPGPSGSPPEKTGGECTWAAPLTLLTQISG